MFICDKNILFLLKITLIKLTIIIVKEHFSQKQGKFIIYFIGYIDIEKF